MSASGAATTPVGSTPLLACKVICSTLAAVYSIVLADDQVGSPVALAAENGGIVSPVEVQVSQKVAYKDLGYSQRPETVTSNEGDNNYRCHLEGTIFLLSCP